MVGLMLYPDKGFFGRLSGLENLVYYGMLYGLSRREARRRAEELLELVGLWEARHRPFEEYSTGMKARLGLAKALVNNPEFLLLDEPTVGIDPVGARRVRELIKGLKREGRTILFTSHNLYEVEELSDDVALIVGGQITARGPPDVLKQRLGFKPAAVVRAACGGEEKTLSRSGDGRVLALLVREAVESGCEVLEAYVRQPPLEEVVVKTLGECMRAGLYLVLRLTLRQYGVLLSVSMLVPFFAALFYLGGWAATGGRADLNKFLYQLVGMVLLVVAQSASSNILWNMYMVTSGGQLEYLAASPSRPLAVLLAFYLVELVVVGLGAAVIAAFIIATLKGPLFVLAMLLAVAVAAVTSLPVVGLTLALAYFLPSIRNPTPLSTILGVAVVFFGGVLYPVTVFPEVLQVLSLLLPFAVWAEFARSVALGLQAPLRQFGLLMGYFAYFAMGLAVWGLLMRRLRRYGLYHAW
jgi:ABC-2 type transport system permease protein